VIIFGFISDRWLNAKKGLLIFFSLIPLTIVLIIMGLGNDLFSPAVSVMLVSLSALLMLGPYSFLAGAIAMDVGGKAGSSTAAGLIDSAGYLGALFSGWGVGKLANSYGWGGTFIILGVVSVVVLITGFFYWFLYERDTKKT
jgi:OPA family glycerol-3-phosphate transporter-like MFS transporter